MKYFCCCHLILNNKQKNFRLSFTSVLFFVCYKKPPFRSHLKDFPEKNRGVVKPENVPVTLVSNPCSSKAQVSEFEFWLSPRTPILSSLGKAVPGFPNTWSEFPAFWLCPLHLVLSKHTCKKSHMDHETSLCIFTSKRLSKPNFHCLSCPMLQPQPSCGVSWCLSSTWKPKTGHDPSDVITQLLEKEELLFWLLFYWIICPIYPFKTCIAVPKYPKVFFFLP